MKLRWYGLAVATAALTLVLPAASAVASGPPWSCTTGDAQGGCPAAGGGYTSYPGTTDFSGLWTFNSPYVDADMWGPVTGETQTVNANSPGDWNAVVNIPAGTNPSGVVSTYPDAGMQFSNPSLSTFGDITSSLADTVPQGADDVGWQGYDNWYNAWGDEVMIQTNFIHQFPCTFVAVQQFGGSNGVPVQTWGLCDFGGAGGEKVWQLAQPTAVVGGENDYSVMETSGSVDISAMTAWLITHGYMLTSTVAATTLTALSAGFEVTETAPGGSTWTYTNLTFENHTGGGGGQAPVVTTSAATGVTTSAATLNGTVNPQAQSTAYHFEYGTTSAYGTSVPVPDGDAGSGSSAVSESANLTGLSASTTYHYRLDATNATGTTNGADQSFTTSAPAGGSVSFGASSGAKKCSNCTSLSWTHTVSGTNPALLVETAVGGDSCVLTAKDGTTTLTRLATVHDNNQTAGYQAVWGLAAPPAGANAITVTATGCSSTHELTGGSLSFTGASQSAPFGAPVTAAGSGAISVTTAGSTTGNMIAGFASNGAPINSATSPATSRYIANQDSNTAAGNSAGATRPATGSGVTMAWSSQSDWWGATAVEVLAG